jgi:hypothetical protein
MRKRARDRGRGTLDSDKRKAGSSTGVRGPVRKRRQTDQQGNIPQQEDTKRKKGVLMERRRG